MVLRPNNNLLELVSHDIVGELLEVYILDLILDLLMEQHFPNVLVPNLFVEW